MLGDVLQDVLHATSADVVAAAQVDQPQVLRGHANERETHNSVRHRLRKPAQIELMRGFQGVERNPPQGLRDHGEA